MLAILTYTLYTGAALYVPRYAPASVSLHPFCSFSRRSSAHIRRTLRFRMPVTARLIRPKHGAGGFRISMAGGGLGLIIRH